ncbi:hypothetical protein SUGI_0854530 [Cryptomeria japonica]|nr:hypothetical protein SUGI_0854530 [Cryptomeria japonica]
MQLKERLNSFEALEEALMPKIWDENVEVKAFDKSKTNFSDILPTLCDSIFVGGKVDPVLFNISLDKLIKLESKLHSFIKETKAALDARYVANTSKVAKVLTFQWPTKEVYAVGQVVIDVEEK